MTLRINLAWIAWMLERLNHGTWQMGLILTLWNLQFDVWHWLHYWYWLTLVCECQTTLRSSCTHEAKMTPMSLQRNFNSHQILSLEIYIYIYNPFYFIWFTELVLYKYFLRSESVNSDGFNHLMTLSSKSNNMTLRLTAVKRHVFSNNPRSESGSSNICRK